MADTQQNNASELLQKLEGYKAKLKQVRRTAPWPVHFVASLSWN